MALAAVTVLLGPVGCGDPPPAAAPSADPTTSPTKSSAAPAPTFGAFSMVRGGNGFTLAGEMPDAGLKASLAESLEQAMPGARIVDDLTVRPGVTGPDFAGLGGLFGAALDIAGFSAKLDGGTVTLAGSAPSVVNKAAAEASAKSTWPNVVVVNDIRVVPPSPAPAPPAPAPPAPTPPKPTP